MPETFPHHKILALDFDGVICNGLREYFEIARRSYLQIWRQDLVANLEITSETWRQDFYNLRPVVETGWEMPLVLRALQLGFPMQDILSNWGTIAQQIITDENLQSSEIAQTVDGLRDQWIAADVDDWLSYHDFYPGVATQIQQAQTLGIEVLIISTKEGRFIQELLIRSGIDLPRSAIFGKETKRPKPEILQSLIATNPQLQALWFVEDRLKTLEQVASRPSLDSVKLFLADWGYNTQTMRDKVINHPRIQLISLTEFSVVGKHFQG